MQRVIVIGNSYSTRLGVIRAVAQLGCEVTVIHIGAPVKPIDTYSQSVKEVLYFNRQEGEDGLVKLLLEKCTVEGQKPIIFPTSDFSALAIDDDEIKKHFAVPYINVRPKVSSLKFQVSNHELSSIGYWMDKSHQKALALSVGLNTAGSVVLERGENGFQIPESIKYPCFTKPVSSIGAGKKCQRRCNNFKELKAVLAIAGKNDITKVLVEDFIDISREYAVLGYSDGKEVVIPGIIKFLKESKTHKGIALAGIVLPVDGFENLTSKFAEFIRQMGFVGIFDIDFLESNGVFYFDEMNLRIGGSGTAILNVGVNLPAMFVKAMCGECTGNMPQAVIQSATFVNENMALGDFSEGKMSLREYRKWNNDADILFIKDETDIATYYEYKKQLRKQIFNYKRILKRMLHVIGI